MRKTFEKTRQTLLYNHSKVILLMAVGLVITSPLSAQKNYSKEILQYLEQLDPNEFSGTILVARNDQIIASKASGWSNMEYQIANQMDTKFNVASISKMFTAVAVLQLVEQGHLKLTQPIGKYLSNYPNTLVRDSVTVHQLLTHTSGNRNFYVENFLESNKLQYREVSDFLQLFANDPLLFSPGKKYHYSAAGFVLLGLIVEKISGQTYYDYLKEHVFGRAGMKNTTELEIDSIVSNKASGYTTFFGESKELKRNDFYLSKASPAGLHYSTAEDLFKFSKALRNHMLLRKETVALMFEPKVQGYNTQIGYGIDVDQRYNQTILGHSGGWYGVRAELMDFMDDNYTVIVLSNIDDDGKSGASKVIDYFKVVVAGKPLNE